MKNITLAACLVFGTVSAASAEPYNLRCTDDGGAEIIVLTVRDSWSPYLTPTIRAERTGSVGETDAVKVVAYTGDKIEIEAPVAIDGQGKRVEGTITASIDRNTGSAWLMLNGPWVSAQGNSRYRHTFMASMGQCAKERPKF